MKGLDYDEEAAMRALVAEAQVRLDDDILQRLYKRHAATAIQCAWTDCYDPLPGHWHWFATPIGRLALTCTVAARTLNLESV